MEQNPSRRNNIFQRLLQGLTGVFRRGGSNRNQVQPQRLTEQDAERHVESVQSSIQNVQRMVMQRSVMGGLQEEQKELD